MSAGVPGDMMKAWMWECHVLKPAFEAETAQHKDDGAGCRRCVDNLEVKQLESKGRQLVLCKTGKAAAKSWCFSIYATLRKHNGKETPCLQQAT